MSDEKKALPKAVKKVIIVLGTIVILVAAGYGLMLYQGKNILSPEMARAKAEKFINDNLLQEGTKVTIKDVKEENGLFNITLEVGGREYNSFMSLDGKKFFQSGMDIEKVEKQTQEDKASADSNQANENINLTKSDKPAVELFVMSHCPYGTQIEKGILPVLQTLGSKIDFTLKFCDYAMHEKKELDEQLAQYCIQKDEPAKLTTYLQCFLNTGESTGCLAQAGIDQTKLKSCVSQTDSQYKVTEKYNDKSTWVSGRFPAFDVYKADNDKYGVQGSPTLVINGTQAASNRDPQSLLKVICSAFNQAPEECNKQLSSATPSPGFGQGTASNSGSAAGCAN